MSDETEDFNKATKVEWRSKLFPGVEPGDVVCTGCYSDPPDWVMAFGDGGDGPRPECTECGRPKNESKELREIPDEKLRELGEKRHGE